MSGEVDKGRPKLDFIHQYFNYDGTKSTCKMCPMSLMGKPAGNLERHLKRKHTQEYDEVQNKRASLQLENAASQSQPQRQRRTDIITIKMSWETVVKSAVTMCTVNGRPLSVVEDSGLRLLLDPILAAINKNAMGRERNINRHNIVRFISDEAQRVREQIRKEVEGKLVCVKIDTASRLDRRVLGINIQYAHGGKLVIRPIAMAETCGSHTGEYLQEMVVKHLEPFGIGPANLYTGTCDNGSNVKKAVNLLDGLARQELSLESPTECPHHSYFALPQSERGGELEEDVDDDLLDVGQLAAASSSSNETLSRASLEDLDEHSTEVDEEDLAFDSSGDESETSEATTTTTVTDSSETEAIQDNLNPVQSTPSSCLDCATLKTALADMGIKVVSCAAHTLQLAVGDALKATPSTRGPLQKARKLVKALRAPLYAGRLKSKGLPKAILDVETRWNSTHAMLSRLLQLRDACNEIAAEEEQQRQAKRRRQTRASTNRPPPKDDKSLPNLSPSEWDSIEAYCSTLLPAKTTTMLFQREQLTVGDCYAAWLRCEEATKKLPTTLAKNLVTCLESRRKDLMRTEAFAPGIFMDPRFKGLLDRQERARAISFLEALWARLCTISSASEEHQDRTEEPRSDLEQEGAQVDSEEDSLERLLRESEASSSRSSSALHSVNISEMLNEYSNWQRVDKNTDVLKFWEGKKESNPELYMLATVALAVPMTQVSVERLFSHLRQILSILRYNLAPSVINDIIVIKCYAAFSS